jgi:hypothetical protein
LRIVLALFGPIVCSLWLGGCGRSEPPSPAQKPPSQAPSTAARPPDGAPRTPDAAAPPAASAASATGVSPDFRARATEALRFIGEDLGRGARRGNETQFDSDLATAREKVKAARAQASTDADTDAALVLTLLLVKDKERYQTILTSRSGKMKYESVQPGIQQLYAEREECARELREWLGISDVVGGQLRSDACLTEAKKAAATLGVQ